MSRERFRIPETMSTSAPLMPWQAGPTRKRGPTFASMVPEEDFDDAPVGTGARLELDAYDPLVPDGPSELPAALSADVNPMSHVAREGAAERARTRREMSRDDQYAAIVASRTPLDADRTSGLSVSDAIAGVVGDAGSEAAEGAFNLFGASPEDAEAARRAVQRFGYRSAAGLPPNVGGASYSPTAMASSLIPFTDELIGAGTAALTDRRYSDVQQDVNERLEEARRNYPGSAMVGSLGQGAMMSLAPVPAMLRAPLGADASIGRTMGQAMGRGAYDMGVYGTMHGADTSEGRPMQRLLETADLVSVQEDPRAMLSQAYSGLGTAAGDMGQLTRDALSEGAVSALVGTAMGTAGGALQTAVRPSAATARLARSQAADAIDAISRGGAPDMDEAALLMELASSPGEGPGISLARRTDPLVPGGETDLPLIDEQFDPGVLGNTERQRLRAAGLQTTAQLRAGTRNFGPQGLSRRMDMYGLLREGEATASIPEVQTRALRLREESGQAIRDAYARATREGVGVDADALARDLEEMAAEREAIRSDVSRREAAQLRAQARTIRGSSTVDQAPQSLPRERPMDTISEASPYDLRAADQTYIERPADTMVEASPFARPDPALRQTARRGRPMRPADTIVDIEEVPPAEAAELMRPEAPLFSRDELGAVDAAVRDARAVTPTAPDPLRVGRVMDSPMIPIDEFTELRRLQADQARGILRGTSTHPTTEMQTSLDVYRRMNQRMDDAIRARYGDEFVAQLQRDRDRFATAASIVPPGELPRNALTDPTLRSMTGRNTGAAIGAGLGTAVGGPMLGTAGGVAGWALGNVVERRLPLYENAIIAALGSRANPSLAAAVRDIAGQISRRVSGRPGYEAVASAPVAEQISVTEQIARSLGDSETIADVADLLSMRQALDGAPEAIRAFEARLPALYARHAGPARALGVDAASVYGRYDQTPEEAIVTPPPVAETAPADTEPTVDAEGNVVFPGDVAPVDQATSEPYIDADGNVVFPDEEAERKSR